MTQRNSSSEVATAKAVLLPSFDRRSSFDRREDTRADAESAYKKGYADAIREQDALQLKESKEEAASKKWLEDCVLEVAGRLRGEFLEAVKLLFTSVAPSLANLEVRIKLAELLEAGVRDIDALSIRINPTLVSSDDDHFVGTVTADESLSRFTIEATWCGGGFFYDAESTIGELKKLIDDWIKEERCE